MDQLRNINNTDCSDNAIGEYYGYDAVLQLELMYNEKFNYLKKQRTD